MHYKRALMEMMKIGKWTQAGIARKIGACNASYVWRCMQPVMKNEKGEVAKRGMTVELFIRMAQAMNGRVVLIWTDPRNNRTKVRWEIDNSDYWGDTNDERFLVPDDED